MKHFNWKRIPLLLLLMTLGLTAVEPELLMTIGPRGRQKILKTAGNTARTGELLWEYRTFRKGRMIQMHSVIRNLTDRELWIEPEIRIPFVSGAHTFWSGFNLEEKIGEKVLSRKGLKGSVDKKVAASMLPFPATAAYDGKQAVFLGGVPFAPVSYTAAFCYPDKRKLGYSIRLVLPPSGKVEFDHSWGKVAGRYGCREAVVRCYHESFPEDWVTFGPDHPYIWGNDDCYASWWMKPDPEYNRRIYATMTWCYCPFRRSGDIYGHDDLSEYKPRNPFHKTPKFGGVMIDSGKFSNAEFRKLRAERYRKYGRRFGWMFYNSCNGTWCERQLAESRYPDALNTDPSVPRVLTTWSTVHDEEVRTFPMGTTFAEVFRKDTARLVQELRLPGLALDCHYGGAYYRGPAVNKVVPGRAWDEKGKFIDQSVALNNLVDFYHTLKVDGKRIVVWGNGYLKGDCHMLEAIYIMQGRFRRNMPLWRWHIGTKPATTSGNFQFKTLVPDWRNLTGEQFLDIYTKMSDYTMLGRFQYGLAIDRTNVGSPRLWYTTPEAQELTRLGWQAEVPLSWRPANLRVAMKSLYGRGVQSVFFAANTSPKDISGTLLMDNHYVADDKPLLYALYTREESCLENRIKGDCTEVAATLLSRTPMLYEAILQASSLPQETSCQVFSRHFLNVRNYSAVFSGQKFSASFRARRIRNFLEPELRLNGVEVKEGQLLEIVPGARLELTYRSDLFAVRAGKILQFPFVDNAGKVDFQVLFGEPSAEAAALRFQEYFDFCRKKKLIDGTSPLPKIAKGKEPVAGTVTLLIRPGRSSVSFDDRGGMLVTASDAEKLDLAVTRLFYVMDQRFDWTLPLEGTSGFSYKIPVFFKLYGHRIPFVKYFGEHR